MKKGRRYLSAFLALVMTLSLLPATALPARAAESEVELGDSDRLGSVSDSNLNTMGFKTEEAGEQAKELMKSAPTGKTPFPLATFHELFVDHGLNGAWYDLLDRDEGAGTGYDPLHQLPDAELTWKLETWGWKDGPDSDKIYITPQAVRSVAFDPAGAGKDQYVAQLVAGKYGNYKNGAIGFVLRVSNAETGVEIDSKWLGNTLFDVDEFYVGALLAIAAGDYNGDGKDELAVYVTADDTAGSSLAYPCVSIYDVYDDGTLPKKSAASKTILDLTVLAGHAFNQVYHFRTVSLATVEGLGPADSLAVAVGAPRDAGKYAGHDGSAHSQFNSYSSATASRLSLWTVPLKGSEAAVIRLSNGLSDLWSQYGATDGDYKDNRETMLYPGVTAGDIDGDRVPEIIVAGYRALNDKGAGWKLDKERMLITYYKLDENGAYQRATLMQWIGLAESDYNGAASLGYGLKDYEIVDPPTLRVFAERGPEYNKSVFVDGVVVNLPTISTENPTQAQAEFQRGLYGGTDKNPDKNLPTASISPNMAFRILYAAPLRALDTTNGYRPASSLGRRTVMDAAVGNFDGNDLGREQVVFTYGMENTSYGKLGTNLCMLDFTAGMGSEGDKVGNNTYVKNAGYDKNLNNVSFSARYLGSGVCYSAAAVDTNDDSVILRYNESKSPKYYFSDPQIIAVLQAAPYFQELKADMDAQPETSFGVLGGGSTEATASITTSARMGVGLDVGVSGGVGASGEVFSVAVMGSLLYEMAASGSVMYETEISRTFSTSWDDAVVLAMTPYAVHYYEQWDPETGRWKDAYIKVPGTPQLSRITLDLYDEIARQQGWQSLRKTALGGARAGDPTSYQSTLPDDIIIADKEQTDQGYVNVPMSGFLTAGYGSGNTTLATTNTVGISAGIEIGGGAQISGRVKVVAVAIEAESSAMITAGLNVTAYAGTELLASTPDMPATALNDYGFQWAFGGRLMKLSGSGSKTPASLVLTYLVRDVNAPPKPPNDLEVEAVGENSVTLSWSKPGNVDAFSYEVGRLVGDYYFPIGTVTPGSDEERFRFTDESCVSGAQYQYAVRCSSYVFGIPRISAYSDPTVATTLSGDSVTILTQPEDQSARVGGSASFQVGLSGGGASNAQYQWQQRQGSGSWEPVQNAVNNSAAVLRLNSLTKDMDGTLYRCQVRTLSGQLFSKSATLYVGQDATQTGLTITNGTESPNSGRANETTMVVEAEPVTRQEQVTATWDGTTYNVVAQDTIEWTETDEIQIPTVTGTAYYLEKLAPEGGSLVPSGTYFLPAEGFEAALKEALPEEGKPSGKSVVIKLTSSPQEIALTVELFDSPNGSGQPVGSGALAGTPKIQDISIPYAVSTDDYQAYQSDAHTVYVAYPGSLPLYYLKMETGGYQQLLLVEGEGEDSFTAVGGGDVPSGLTPNILSAKNLVPANDAPKTIAFSSGADAVTTVPCNYYESSAPESNESVEAGDTSFPAVVVADLPDGTRYYTVEAENSLTQVYAKTSYTYGGNTVLAEFDPAALYTVSAAVSGSVSRVVGTHKPGMEVNLTATVKERATNGTVTGGTVTFQIVNTSASSIETCMAPLSADGTAAAAWTPSQPGVYQITAIYQGSGQWQRSESEPEAYTAYLNASGWLSLAGGTAMEVGGSLTLTPSFFEEQLTEGTEVTVNYTVIKDGEVADGLFDVNTFKPKATGTYLITAKCEVEGVTYTASKSVTVAKKAVTVAVKSLNIGADSWGGMLEDNKLVSSGDTLEIRGADLDYSLFALTAETRGEDGKEYDLETLPAGRYFVNVGWADGAEKEAATATYEISFQRGILTMAPNTVQVHFRAEEHGSLRARFGSSEIQTGAYVNKNAQVNFEASPEKGSVVDHWIVKVDGEIQEELTHEGKQNISVDIDGELDVTVCFKAQTFEVKYASQPQKDGGLSAYYNDKNGELIESGAQVPAGAKVCFVATPEEGRTIQKWTVNGSALTINNATYTASTYTIDRLNEDVDVKAVYDDQRTFTVAAAAVDENGNPAGLMGTVSASGIANSDGSYNSGAQVTLTAAPGAGYRVAEWRSYTGDDYTVLQGNVLAYTLSDLRQDWDIRVVFSGEKTHHVTYGPTDETVSAGGVVTAAITGGSEVGSGTQQPAGSPLTFTAVAASGQELAHWLVNGQIRQATGSTHHIPALNADVDVQAVFQVKPTISFTGPDNGTIVVKVGSTSVENGDNVPYGSEVTVTLTPDNRHEASALTVNGVDVLANARYTDGSGATTDQRVYTFTVTLRGENRITAAFSEIPSAEVSFSAEGSGTVSGVYVRKGVPEDPEAVESPITAYRDGVVTLTAAPEETYRLTGWTLNGEPVGDSSATLTLPITAELIEKGEGGLEVKAVIEPMGSSLYFDVQGEGEIAATLNGTDTPVYSNSVVTAGATVNLTVTPDSDWELDAWLVNNEVQSDAAELTFTYTATNAGAHIVARLKREVTVNFGGTNGTVTAEANGTALKCGNAVPYGTAVTFRAFPDPAYALTGWGNAAEGNANPLILTANSDLDVTAQFEAAEKTALITFANPANGTLTAAKGGADFKSGGKATLGDVIVFTVEPSDNYAVSGWSNNGVPVTGARENTYSLTVTGDHEIAAALVPTAYTVSYSVDGLGGTINGETGGSLDAKSGETVTLTAVPESGKMVEGWYLGDSQDPLPGTKGQNTYVIDAVNRDMTVKVKFTDEASFTLTIEHNGEGMGTVKASVNGGAPQPVTGALADLRYGDTVVLTAEPQNGYSVFGGWSERGPNSISLGTAPTLNLGAITANKMIVATFNAQARVNLSVTWVDGNCSVTGQAGYDALKDLPLTSGSPISLTPGQKVTLTATPNEANKDKVAQWKVNGVLQTKLQNTLTIDSLTQNTAIGVEFVQPVTLTIQQPIGGTISVKAGGTTLQSGDVVPVGTELSLTATPSTNYEFTAWGDGASGLANASGTIKADGTTLTISASFTRKETGGGGGGGGGGTPVTPPADNDKTVIDDKTGDQLIDDAEKNGGDIKIDADKPAVSLPSGFLKDAGGKTNADILISTPVAAIRLPNGALGDLASLGGEITVQATLEKNQTGQQVLTLNVTADGKRVGQILGGVKVTVPYTGGGPNTVAILEDGSGMLLPKSFAMAGQMTIPLSGPASAILTDNPQNFLDTANHWGAEYIDFATSHGLFHGVAEGVFDADGTMTRAMLWTVLAKLEGMDTTGGTVWYEKGMEWAKENGISDGLAPNGAIAREQLAVMLWRVTGSPAADQELAYTDTDQASDYALEALRWAVEHGILSGKGNGMLDPKGSATRAEVAAMLLRFITEI